MCMFNLVQSQAPGMNLVKMGSARKLNSICFGSKGPMHSNCHDREANLDNVVRLDCECGEEGTGLLDTPDPVVFQRECCDNSCDIR